MSAQSEDSFLYFAYGSNLLPNRLMLANPSAVKVAVGKALDYKLNFVGKKESTWHGGGATIQKNEGDNVYGVVYRISFEDLPNLNRQETGYDSLEIEVVTLDGQKIICISYMHKNITRGLYQTSSPSPHYLEVIIQGAIENELPEEYIEQLKTIQHNNYCGTCDMFDSLNLKLQFVKIDLNLQ